ncbi:solute carrier family 13 member 2-like [Macrobrachium nipponense]|uniref:solute carrier family 13 member 2-like n=1 Tax=Macrobrachium nipponense TaxID=159736 RepID=UPI0030C87E94
MLPPRTILKMYWRTFLLILSPIIVAILPIVSATDEAKCGYVMIMMAIFWMTEMFPLPVTALIPVFAFPFLGILPTGEVTQLYMKENIMMYIGGMMIAVASEHCNLHKRIALFGIFYLGESPRRLLAGVMLTTMFLSMWIASNAATAWMVKVVDALLIELFLSSEKVEESIVCCSEYTVTYNGRGRVEVQGIENAGYVADDDCESGRNKNVQIATKFRKVKEEKPRPKNILEMTLNDECRALKDMFFLSVAYSANLGGTGSMTGTSTNLVLRDVLGSTPTGLNFASWMAFSILGMLLCVTLAWIWLQVVFVGLCRKERQSSQELSPAKGAAQRKIMSDEYAKMGPMTHHEITVFSLFIVMVLVWFFRSPEFIPGWSYLFKDATGKKYEINDASSVILIILALFALPANLSFFKNIASKDETPLPAAPGCLNWKVAQARIPWGIFIVMGGGIAMAEGWKKSGLSSWMAQQLTVFNAFPKEATVFCVCLFLTALTDVTANAPTASIFLPVLKEMAVNFKVNPLYLMLPATICCSCAFMLPVSSPSNAIVFNVSGVQIKDMMKAGSVMIVLCVIVITGMTNTVGVLIFDLHTMPAWANSSAVS